MAFDWDSGRRSFGGLGESQKFVTVAKIFRVLCKACLFLYASPDSTQ